jgi:1-acyl-sn-glycerol-3-phosphate acyltransferase
LCINVATSSLPHPSLDQATAFMIRVTFIASALVVLTLALLPFQLIGIAFDLRLQRTIPHLYHRILCALIGVRIRQTGRRSTASPMLILSNHVSWLDICVVSALAPVVFVAKNEVAGWPVFGWLAKLQRTIFIDRKARHQTGAATREIAGRMLGGDAVVLFAEGTSSDGTRVLPFLLAGWRGPSRTRQLNATQPCHRAADVAGLCRLRRAADGPGHARARGMVRRCRPRPASASIIVVGSRRCHRELGRGDRL